MGETKDIIAKIKSIKESIEAHFIELERELKNNDTTLSYYHFKEVLRSMLPSLFNLYQKLGKEEQGKLVIKNLQGRLEKMLKENNLFDEYKRIFIDRFGQYP